MIRLLCTKRDRALNTGYIITREETMIDGEWYACYDYKPINTFGKFKSKLLSRVRAERSRVVVQTLLRNKYRS